VQQLQLQGHPWPLAVHATYQFEDALDCAFGKRERMREWGLWLADSPEHMAAEVEGLSGRDDGTEDGGDDGDAGYGCEEEAAAARVEKPRTGEGGSSGGAAGTVASAPPIERFLVLEDNERGQIAPSVPWVPTDPHARGRQHVEHIDRFRQRLASGVLLARALNRTVVLPPFFCYCDKYWARLTRCTVGAQALATQPLPFQCPMDHLVPIGNWHGTVGARKRRGERCALPARADGPPEQGMPYRTHAWLRAARMQPRLSYFGGTLVAVHSGQGRAASTGAHAAAQTPGTRASTPAIDGLPQGGGGGGGAGRAVTSADLPPNGGELADGGTIIHLEAGSSDKALRAAISARRLSSTPMLRVSLTDASALLGCVADGAAATKLLSQLFQMRWCWRPEEMTEPRYDAATNQTTDVCVWGFKTPGAPPQCA
jgi:hypothetical protein